MIRQLVSPSHSYFSFGIICGRLWGSLAVEDHLRSRDQLRLGIICGTVQAHVRTRNKVKNHFCLWHASLAKGLPHLFRIAGSIRRKFRTASSKKYVLLLV